MTDTLDTRRKRLLFRSWHRGTKEMDLLLGGFADRALAAMDESELDLFEALLEVPEPSMASWLISRVPPPPGFDHHILRRLIAFTDAPGKT